jgi:hypothetical protein
MAAGFTQPRTALVADTARVDAGPQALAGAPPRAGFIATVVAYPLGDSVRVRFGAGWVAPPRGWATPSDSIAARSQSMRLCAMFSNALMKN